MTVDDSLLEPDEELTFTISRFSEDFGISIVAPDSHILTIMDNDGKKLMNEYGTCINTLLH